MITGRILQLNISKGGVPKRLILSANVGRLGIDGDKHLYRLHGGPQKALLLMAAEFIDTLATEGFSVYYGALGENLTTQGLDPTIWRAGQRYRAGTVLLELTEMRVSCRKLDRYGAGIQRRIQGQSGFYAAVLQEGVIYPGDIIELVDPVVNPCPSPNL